MSEYLTQIILSSKLTRINIEQNNKVIYLEKIKATIWKDLNG